MIEIHTVPVTAFAQNARVLFDTESKSAWLVDPGGDVARLIELLMGLQPQSVSVVLTHAHIDHAGGVRASCASASDLVDSPVELCAYHDRTLRGTIAQQAMVFGLSPQEFEDVPEPSILLNEGSELTLGAHVAKVYWTPGHAPDHISLYFDSVEAQLFEDKREVGSHNGPLLVVGDALFAGSVGRTDLPGGSFPQLLHSIKEKLLPLPDETLVCSGHGPNTTIGAERLNNPFLQG